MEALFSQLKCKQLSKKFFEYVISDKGQNGYFPLKELMHESNQYTLPPAKQATAKEFKYPTLAQVEKGAFDPEIVFLGTGCQKFSSYRAVSCIFIRNPATGDAVMLDCGEASSY